MPCDGRDPASAVRTDVPPVQSAERIEAGCLGRRLCPQGRGGQEGRRRRDGEQGGDEGEVDGWARIAWQFASIVTR